MNEATIQTSPWLPFIMRTGRIQTGWLPTPVKRHLYSYNSMLIPWNLFLPLVEIFTCLSVWGRSHRSHPYHMDMFKLAHFGTPSFSMHLLTRWWSTFNWKDFLFDECFVFYHEFHFYTNKTNNHLNHSWRAVHSKTVYASNPIRIPPMIQYM